MTLRYCKLYTVIFVFIVLLMLYFSNFKSRIILSGETLGIPLMSEYNDLLVIYNKIPKSGSTTFVNLMYNVSSRNKFNIAQLTVSNKVRVINPYNQLKLIRNISSWHNFRPAFLHGHFHFIDFSKYSSIKPVYINMVRDPLERLVSSYYFLRFGDDFRPEKTRARMNDTDAVNQTFDECFVKKGSDCSPYKLWVQIPFFCGNAKFCREVGNPLALYSAKLNLVNQYLLVGINEQMERFIQAMEVLLPEFFYGASLMYKSEVGFGDRVLRLRKTKFKKPLNSVTRIGIQKSTAWKMEMDFYNFAQAEFKNKYESLLANIQHRDENQQTLKLTKVKYASLFH